MAARVRIAMMMISRCGKCFVLLKSQEKSFFSVMMFQKLSVGFYMKREEVCRWVWRQSANKR